MLAGTAGGALAQGGAGCDPLDLYDDGCRRVVVAADRDGFSAGLWYAGPGGQARRVAGVPTRCPGCEWEVAPACDANRPDGSGGGGPAVNCSRAALSCRPGQLVSLWLRRPGEPFRPTATFCLPVGGRVVSPADLAGDVAAAWRRLPLPEPRPVVQPAGRAVVGIPAALHAVAEPPRAVEVAVDGFAVTLSARPARYRWSVAGTAVATTDRPGGPYPRHAAAYAFPAPGEHALVLDVAWTADYVVAGTDVRVPVPGVVTRTAVARVAVRPARAVLVGD